MKISLAHIRERSTSGGWVDLAVFNARSQSGSTSGNAALLSQLKGCARSSGLKVDQAALAFNQNGRTQFYGDKNLVSYLSNSGVPTWTHSIEV